MQEVWKDIEGFEGKYQVSNLGNVRSLNYHRGKSIKLLKNKLTKDGYYETSLSKNNHYKYIRTHRLVAQAFIPNPENKPQVNHIDGNKLNNNVKNLEWCTNYENILHAIKNGLEKIDGHENPNAKEVYQIDIDGKIIKKWDCIKYASEELGINASNISMVANNYKGRKTSGGYIWRFKNANE